MENNIAVVSVPLQEWTDLKSQIKHIGKSLIELKTKDKSEFLTPNEACELLKCSRNTYQSYVDNGSLEVVKMKNKKYSKVLIKRAELYSFLENKNAMNGN